MTGLNIRNPQASVADEVPAAETATKKGMDLFHWSDDFSVNIQEVDEQHKVLVSLLNQLHEAIRERRGKAVSREILDRLADYTRTHFMLEESLMRLTHYSGFAIHKQQHEELIAQVHDLQKNSTTKTSPSPLNSCIF